MTRIEIIAQLVAAYVGSKNSNMSAEEAIALAALIADGIIAEDKANKDSKWSANK